MIVVNFWGRLGNNLIQYALARVISNELGYNIQIAGDNHTSSFNCVVNINDKQSINQPSITFNDVDNPGITLQQILDEGRGKRIELIGFWQKADFYKQYRQQLKEWMFVPKSDYGQYIDRDNDVILHIRRADYSEANSVLSFDYYDHCLSQLNFNKLQIVGDGIDDRVRNHFQKYNPAYFNGSAFEDFKFIMCFKNVILSNSTFCWMASFLSDNAEKVFYPEPVSGYWSMSQNQRLFIEGFHTKIENVQVGQG